MVTRAGKIREDFTIMKKTFSCWLKAPTSDVIMMMMIRTVNAVGFYTLSMHLHYINHYYYTIIKACMSVT